MFQELTTKNLKLHNSSIEEEYSIDKKNSTEKFFITDEVKNSEAFSYKKRTTNMLR